MVFFAERKGKSAVGSLQSTVIGWQLAAPIAIGGRQLSVSIFAIFSRRSGISANASTFPPIAIGVPFLQHSTFPNFHSSIVELSNCRIVELFHSSPLPPTPALESLFRLIFLPIRWCCFSRAILSSCQQHVCPVFRQGY